MHVKPGNSMPAAACPEGVFHQKTLKNMGSEMRFGALLGKMREDQKKIFF